MSGKNNKNSTQKDPQKEDPQKENPQKENPIVEDTGPSASLLFSKVGGAKEKKQAFMMRVSEAVIKKEKLKYLKALMVAQNSAKEYASLSFCTEGGAVVDNDWKIQDYLDSLKGSEDDKETDNTGKNKKTDQPKTHSLYLRRPFDRTALDDSIIPKIDLKLPDDATYLDPIELKKLKSTLNLANWRAATGSANEKAPVELTESEWERVAINNSLCYGLCIVRVNNGSETIGIGVKRARYPAFQIKARKVGMSNEPAPTLRIPDFIVDDQSYVTICETQSQFQNSLSNSAFTTWDILYSGAMSFAGFQLGSSAGYRQSTSKQTTSLKENETAQMNISYNFPRATLILDEYSLELTPECKNHLVGVKDEKSMKTFLELYGEYFSRQIQLGGRLFASEDFVWKGEGSGSDVKKSLTIQAASSLKGEIKGVGLAAGPQAGGTHASGDAANTTTGEMNNALQWQANGGDTLLCNNPPQWCPTVASHLNWRIINRAENCHMVDLLAKFPGQLRLKKFVENNANYNELNKALQPKAGRMFYLRNGDEFQYLTAFHQACLPENARIVEVLQSGPSGYTFLVATGDYIGTAVVHRTVTESNQHGCYFEFETPEGVPVTKVEYGKPYVMRSPATDLYLSFEYGKPDIISTTGTSYSSEDLKPSLYLVARPERPDGSNLNQYVCLRGQRGEMNGEVAQGDSVTLRTTGSDPLILVSCVALLQAHKNEEGAAEKSFKLMYQDQEKK
ncbi:hypothetical protein BJX61DRAFT_546403 [Aspergillus egyptiacus]|nr:hypothetical protein BJX61DRAFT_546403 [Aspergillus egyptiacus]